MRTTFLAPVCNFIETQVTSVSFAVLEERYTIHHEFMRSYFGYILLCKDGSYYVGITYDVERRVAQHVLGLDPDGYTHERRPVKLVYSTEFSYVWDAIAWEKKIKRWSRKKKEALIAGDQEALEHFARRKSGKARKYMKNGSWLSPSESTSP